MNKTATIRQWDRHDGLVQGYSTKGLGNLSVRTGDRAVIDARRREFAALMGIDWSDRLFLPITHSDRVLSLPKDSIVKKDADGQYVSGGHVFAHKQPAVCADEARQSGIDAVVTNTEGMYPIILSADCACVAFYDSRRRVCGLAHAGLVGAVNGIVRNTVECMVGEYGCDPRDIEVAIFPSIRTCHYDVRGSGVWKAIGQSVLAHYGEGDPAFSGDRVDLHALITRQLVGAGVPLPNIVDTGLCTVCHRDDFFSNHAAGDIEAKKKEGRFASIVGMRRA